MFNRESLLYKRLFFIWEELQAKLNDDYDDDEASVNFLLLNNTILESIRLLIKHDEQEVENAISELFDNKLKNLGIEEPDSQEHEPEYFSELMFLMELNDYLFSKYAEKVLIDDKTFSIVKIGLSTLSAFDESFDHTSDEKIEFSERV